MKRSPSKPANNRNYFKMFSKSPLMMLQNERTKKNVSEFRAVCFLRAN